MIDQTSALNLSIPDWIGQPLPEEEVYQRRISAYRTIVWWIVEHHANTLWHQRFGQGYCHRCHQEN